jgi:MtfA peptidase
MQWLRKRIRQYKAKKLLWQDNERWFQAVLHRVPGLLALPAMQQSQLRELVKEFLVSKKIFGAQGLEIDTSLKLKIATLACWPALYLGFAALDGFSSVVVYPETFHAMRERVDANTGLVIEYQQSMAGETSQHGPVVLSKADIERDLAGLGRFGNVVLHEIAHKIDALDGAIDGVPPLRIGISGRAFSATMQSAFDSLQTEIRNYSTSSFDAYAAHSPPEFFAVTSEYYFLAPQHLAAIYPDVFAALDQFYRGDCLSSAHVSSTALRAT